MQCPKPKQGSKRFPLSLQLQFKIAYERDPVVGTGHTLLMSSEEIVFRADRMIRPDANLELAIAWPVLLEDRVGLRLIVQGRILSTRGAIITVATSRYQFRTRSIVRESYAWNDTPVLPVRELLDRPGRAVREANA